MGASLLFFLLLLTAVAMMSGRAKWKAVGMAIAVIDGGFIAPHVPLLHALGA